MSSIPKGEVQDTELVITVEEQIFQKQEEKVLTMPSSKILSCNPHGPAAGWVRALHA